MKKFKHVGVAISMLFLCSCSASFTYNNLSWLSSFWVDDYVDLNKQQNKQLKKLSKQHSIGIGQRSYQHTNKIYKI
ncbi:hypothetical protein [Pseudoalteromonas sp. B62]